MDRATVDVYEKRAEEWAGKRSALHRERARHLAGRALPGLPVADLGCGPGNYLADLGPAVVAVDAAAAMLALANARHPAQGAARALPPAQGAARALFPAQRAARALGLEDFVDGAHAQRLGPLALA